MSLVALVVVVLVIAVLYWALERILTVLAVQEPVRTIALVVFALVAVLWLLAQVGLLSYTPVLHVR